ncbi:hypothetical protein FE257_003131 [Aspergillus nanangensis]|uniref:Uncharacterized protein n=1 Tax=Aspergillus nanangensis TaxID=2582783 RepID=A0AAD4CBX1_ASPNN|nr:hypothetical protein FE257_003131 [Aspergillus nanangensis]
MHYRKNSYCQGEESSGKCGGGLDVIFATVRRVYDLIPELQPASKKAESLENLIGLACMALVFNHEPENVIRRVQPGLWGLASILPEQQQQQQQQELDNILPLLVLTRRAELVQGYLSTKEAEVDINKYSSFFGTALCNAAAINDVEVVKMLLAHGANTNQTGGRWHGPLQASVAYSDSVDTLSILLDAGADVNLQGGANKETALMSASKAHNHQAVSVLLSCKGIDVNLLSCTDESILHYLCRGGDVDNLRKLLADHPGVDVKHRSEYGTALHAAMNLECFEFTDGHDEVVNILLERGLSPKDVAFGAETCVVGWAENIKEEAEEAEVEVPAAVERILQCRR